MPFSPTSVFVLLISVALSVSGFAEERSIRVFVALCDNQTQGIIKVGAKIGDGDSPDSNLYWGCSDGLGKYFPRSGKWEVVKTEHDVDESILRRLLLKHKNDDGLTLVAEAWRGSEMRNCWIAFEEAIASKKHAVVAYIGHNALMDNTFLDPETVTDNPTQSIVLACVSETYCKRRLAVLGSEPILLTRQLMYPGSFLLHDAIESWRNGGDKSEIRSAAGRAYAKNQGISVKAGTGIFAELTATPSQSNP